MAEVSKNWKRMFAMTFLAIFFFSGETFSQETRDKEEITTMGQQLLLGNYIKNPDIHNNKMVFSLNVGDDRKANYEIFVMNTDGSGLKRLTFTTDVNEKNPKWTDRKNIRYYKNGAAFVIDINGNELGSLEQIELRKTTEKLKKMKDLFMSDKSNEIMTEDYRNNKIASIINTSGINKICIKNKNDSSKRILLPYHRIDVLSIKWLPDGKIVFIGVDLGADLEEIERGYRPYIVDCDGTNLQKISKEQYEALLE